MGSFLLFILAILLFIVLFVVSIGLSLLRGIFNFFSGNKNKSRQDEGSFYENEQNAGKAKSNGNGEKVFGKEEGEYIEFEEYKPDENKNQQS